MDVVFGSSPLARSLAAALTCVGPACLASPAPQEGAFLWRRAELETGEGVRPILRAARRCWVVLDAEPDATAHGVFLGARRTPPECGVVIMPFSRSFPPGLTEFPTWSRLEIGPCWGAEEPLVARWAAQLLRGRRLWIADPGGVSVLPMPDAVRAAVAAASHPGVRWRLTGNPVHFPDLVAALSAQMECSAKVLRVPLPIALRRIDVAVDRVRSWLDVPAGIVQVDPWTPPPSAGSAGWTDVEPATLTEPPQAEAAFQRDSASSSS